MCGSFLGAELGGEVPEEDLHGMTRSEAMDTVDRLIHFAFMRRERVIRVIHGHGTGVLKIVVKSVFKTHPNVKSFKIADGVSYAEIESR